MVCILYVSAEIKTKKMASVTKALPQKKYYRQRAHSNPIADHCIE